MLHVGPVPLLPHTIHHIPDLRHNQRNKLDTSWSLLCVSSSPLLAAANIFPFNEASSVGWAGWAGLGWAGWAGLGWEERGGHISKGEGGGGVQPPTTTGSQADTTLLPRTETLS